MEGPPRKRIGRGNISLQDRTDAVVECSSLKGSSAYFKIDRSITQIYILKMLVERIRNMQTIELCFAQYTMDSGR